MLRARNMYQLRAPLKYHSKIKELNREQPAVQKFRIDNEEIKIGILTFREGDEEQYLRTIREFGDMVTTYNLWANENAQRVYSRFRRCFLGDSLDTWVETIEGMDLNQQKISLLVSNMTEIILREGAAEDQIEYLRTTKKPKDLTSKNWIRRLRSINRYLPYMQHGQQRLGNNELARIVSETLPRTWRKDFRLARGNRSGNLQEVVKILNKIEESEAQERPNTKTSKKNMNQQETETENDKSEQENKMKRK